MADQAIQNPLGVHTTVSDWRTMKDAYGGEIPVGKTVRVFRANEAIAVGLAVCVVAPASATAEFGVDVATAGDGYKNVGIAATAATAADQTIEVVTEGLAFGVLGGTVTAGACVLSDANGKLVAETEDADTVAGTIIGTALAGGDADATVPVWVRLA